ncbi:unnamed protein product, partial [Allacma fusca]
EFRNPTPVVYDVNRDNMFTYRIPIITAGKCFLCDRANPLYALPFKCRVDFFMKTGLFLPRQTNSCRAHITRNEKEFVIDVHFLTLQSEMGIILMSPLETSDWFAALRTAGGTMEKTAVQNRILSLEDEDFRQVLGVRKEHFRDLCNVVCDFRQQRLTCKPISVMLLLMKLRNCQFILFLKSLFGFSSRRTVSSEIKIARLSLMARFVPLHLGPPANPRPEALGHVNDLARQLHLSENNHENAVLIVDGTYVYIPKSGNFTVLKRSYSQHKGRHLLKMNMFVLPDGRIFDAHGPFFSDAKNNDAATLRYELQQNISGIRNWLIPGDVVVVDRGYRDIVPYLQELGLDVSIPFCAPRNQGQIPTQEANDSRVTTKTRWVVEVRNGHISQIFKYFGRQIHAQNVPFTGDYFKICCALINAYYPTIALTERSLGMGVRILELRNSSNILMEYLQTKDLLNPRIRRVWRDMADEELEDFPRMTEDELHDLTLSVFQLKLAPSYTAAQDYVFQVYKEESDLLRVKMNSRHSLSTFYYVFLRFRPNVNGSGGISAWYCTCKGGSRTAGMCAHCAAILWYLTFARYEPVIPGPSNRILEIATDAAGRYGNVNVVNDNIAD